MGGSRAAYKREAGLPPGGMKCPCCGPAPGKVRKRVKRSWKRSERRRALQAAREEMEAA